MKLYQHQIEAVNDLRKSLAHNRRVLLQAPTGMGKSVMAAYMIHSSANKGRLSLFVVPRRALLRQMSNTFKTFGIKHGFIAAGIPFYKGYNVYVCTLQTLVDCMGDVTPDVVFLDEAHWGSQTMDTVIKEFERRGIFVIGLSATPARQDNFGMADWYEEMVTSPSIRWLIDNKFLSDYRLIQPSIQVPKGCLGGDPVEEWEKHAEGRLTIGFCRDKAHGYSMAELFNRYKIPAAFVESDTPQEIRTSVISKFADGEIKVLFNAYLFQMGFDLASQIGRKVNVRCMLDLQRTESLTTQLQKNGRALRYDEAGEAVIIDLVGNTYEESHGFPCSDREWVLEHGDLHKKDVESRAATLNLIYCKKCFKPFKVAFSVCPDCGTKFVFDTKKIREVDGKLIVVTPEMLRAENEIEEIEKKNNRMEQGKARTIADLQKIANERGYKSGWVYKQAQLKGIRS